MKEESVAGRDASTPQIGAGRCLNCGTPLVGDFCHACGQKGGQVLSLGRLVTDGLGELLDVDAPLLSSLRLLLFRPGRLASAYLAGRRASLVSPVRLYLVASLLFGAALLFADETVQLSLEGAVVPDRAMWLRAWSWTVLVMMPSFAGLLAIAVPGRRPLVEHLVFAMYVHAFGYIVAAFGLAVAEAARGTPLSAIALLLAQAVVLVQLYRALRDSYGMGPARTAVSTLALAAAYAFLQLVALVVAGVALGRLSP